MSIANNNSDSPISFKNKKSNSSNEVLLNKSQSDIKLGEKYKQLINQEDTNYKKNSFLTFNPDINEKSSKFKENSLELKRNLSEDNVNFSDNKDHYLNNLNNL